MYQYLQSLEKFGINLGLDRIRRLLEQLGNPHLKFKSIHVAGTNGKGSTSAMIASILKEAGYKVGLYTSPHLFDYRERIQVNGKDIPRKEFSEGIRRVKRAAEDIRSQKGQPTVFEVLTAVAFWYFASEKVDYAVVEVGLGGRLDATNVITPLVSVITNIDYEHTAILGKTLTKIAAEKAAIIKPGVPVVTAERKREPLDVIRRIAKKNKSMIRAWKPRRYCRRLPLAGEHQKINAACAVAAIRLARIPVSGEEIRQGLKKVRWPGRFEVVSRRPLTIVDGAHNPSGIKVLIDTLKEQFPRRKFSFIIGVQKDKDARAMLNEINLVAKKIVITRSSHRQAASEVAGVRAVKLKEALKLTADDDRVITGSLFLVADVLTLFRGHSRM